MAHSGKESPSLQRVWAWMHPRHQCKVAGSSVAWIDPISTSPSTVPRAMIFMLAFIIHHSFRLARLVGLRPGHFQVFRLALVIEAGLARGDLGPHVNLVAFELVDRAECGGGGQDFARLAALALADEFGFEGDAVRRGDRQRHGVLAALDFA